MFQVEYMYEYSIGKRIENRLGSEIEVFGHVQSKNEQFSVAD